MRKYPLGHAIIEWVSGGYSEAVIYQDSSGKQFFACANWVSGPVALEKYKDNIDNIITDYDDIYLFLRDKAEEEYGNSD